MENLLFFELTADVLTSGKAFDALTVGTFTDMYGRKSTFRKKDLPKYVENTKAVIAASETDSGEIVGLPIDAVDHDKGDGAGWIIDIELDAERDVIQLTPNWTSIGIEVIEGKIRRFFSASIDISQKTILGGTLTNWPAIRDKKGSVLLKPVELSMNPEGHTDLLEFDEESFDEQSRNVRDAFYEEFGFDDYDLDPYVREVFESHIIVRSEGKNWQVEYKISKDDEFAFQEEDKWTEVKQTWIEAIKNKIGSVIKPGAKDPETIKSEDNIMTIEMTQEELKAAIAEEVGTVLTAEMSLLREAMVEAVNPVAPEGEEDGSTADTPDIFERFDLKEQKELARDEMKQELADQFEAIRADVRSESTLQIGKIRREAYLSEFAGRVTSGNDEVPYGVPVEAGALKTWLISLDVEQSEFAQKMIDGFWKSGRIEFAELGHTRDEGGDKKLPDDILEQLRAGELTLEDLRSPIMFPVIGELAQYDLAEFRKEG